MEQKAGPQISQKAFIQSLLILFALMLFAGVLTLIVPAGSYARTVQDGREVIDPASFQYVARPDYPAWRWLTAPFEVLAGPDSAVIIVIIVFLLMVGSAFAVLDKSGALRLALARLVAAFGGRKYLLLLAISLFFMIIGAFFGIFEEIVPLVPIMIALAYALGWDSLTGLGMSILATNMGFSAAITNPFTLGVAQKLAGLPLFSGAWLRVPIFIVIYIVFAIFLVRHARRVERDPLASPVYKEDQASRSKYASFNLNDLSVASGHAGRVIGWLVACLALIGLILVSGPFVPVLSDLTLPIVGLLFLAAGIGAGVIAGMGGKEVFKAAIDGIGGIAPAVPLILMAASIKYIVAAGGIMDTMLYSLSLSLSQANSFVAALIVYALALLIEFFIASGSAKAFLLMPILLPLADLVGVTRQVTVLAYCFGDGFSNLAYPTNPVLLICLGLTVVSYPKWLKWSLGLWVWVILVTVAALALAVAIQFGPF